MGVGPLFMCIKWAQSEVMALGVFDGPNASFWAPSCFLAFVIFPLELSFLFPLLFKIWAHGHGRAHLKFWAHGAHFGWPHLSLHVYGSRWLAHSSFWISSGLVFLGGLIWTSSPSLPLFLWLWCTSLHKVWWAPWSFSCGWAFGPSLKLGHFFEPCVPHYTLSMWIFYFHALFFNGWRTWATWPSTSPMSELFPQSH